MQDIGVALWRETRNAKETKESWEMKWRNLVADSDPMHGERRKYSDEVSHARNSVLELASRRLSMDLGIWLQCELKRGNGANMFFRFLMLWTCSDCKLFENRSHVVVLSTELPDQRMVHLKEWHEMRNICAIRKYTNADRSRRLTLSEGRIRTTRKFFVNFWLSDCRKGIRRPIYTFSITPTRWSKTC